MDKVPSIIPMLVAIFFIRNMIKIGSAAARKQKSSGKGSQSLGGRSASLGNGQSNLGGSPSIIRGADQTGMSSTRRPQKISSAKQPKPWQIGKHDVTPTSQSFNGKRSNGMPFGDERDIISSSSMAASNAEYVDVGNDYVSGFDVGGRRETPIGFDR